jgi:hypothetical protein
MESIDPYSSLYIPGHLAAPPDQTALLRSLSPSISRSGSLGSDTFALNRKRTRLLTPSKETPINFKRSTIIVHTYLP